MVILTGALRWAVAPCSSQWKRTDLFGSMFLASCSTREGAIWTVRGSWPVSLLSVYSHFCMIDERSSFRCKEYFSSLLIFRKLELNFVFLATSFLSSTAGVLPWLQRLWVVCQSIYDPCLHHRLLYDNVLAGGNKALMECLSFLSLNKFLWDRIRKPSWKWKKTVTSEAKM